MANLTFTPVDENGKAVGAPVPQPEEGMTDAEFKQKNDEFQKFIHDPNKSLAEKAKFIWSYVQRPVVDIGAQMLAQRIPGLKNVPAAARVLGLTGAEAAQGALQPGENMSRGESAAQRGKEGLYGGLLGELLHTGYPSAVQNRFGLAPLARAIGRGPKPEPFSPNIPWSEMLRESRTMNKPDVYFPIEKPAKAPNLKAALKGPIKPTTQFKVSPSDLIERLSKRAVSGKLTREEAQLAVNALREAETRRAALPVTAGSPAVLKPVTPLSERLRAGLNPPPTPMQQYGVPLAKSAANTAITASPTIRHGAEVAALIPFMLRHLAPKAMRDIGSEILPE